MYGQEMRWNMPGRRQKILAFSDLHFCKRIVQQRAGVILKTLQQVCQREDIDYVFCLGDLINSLVVLDDVALRQSLEGFLRRLAEVTPVILVIGNHDISDYTKGANKGKMQPEKWYVWARDLTQNPRIMILDAALGEGKEIFDDGKMRVLGMHLPEVCYPTRVEKGRDSVVAFREYAERVLPRLTEVEHREYYLLLHNPAFLERIQLDPQIAVLAGHMHNGLVPPLLDELTRFSSRGIVGPGYYNHKGYRRSYISLPKGARYRPRAGRPWLTLNACTHLPPESWLGNFDGIFPALSYVIITGDEPEMRFSSQYFRFRY